MINIIAILSTICRLYIAVLCVFLNVSCLYKWNVQLVVSYLRFYIFQIVAHNEWISAL